MAAFHHPSALILLTIVLVATSGANPAADTSLTNTQENTQLDNLSTSMDTSSSELENAIAGAASDLPEDAQPVIIASPSSFEQTQSSTSDQTIEDTTDSTDGHQNYDLYLVDTSRLPAPLAQLVHGLPGLDYGQNFVTFLHKYTNGLVPNAGLIAPNETLVKEEVASSDVFNADSQSVSTKNVRSAATAPILRERRGLLLGKGLLAKKLVGTKLLLGKGIVLKKLLLAKAIVLPVMLKAKKVAIVKGLLAKPFLLKGLLVGKKVGIPLLAAGAVKAGLAKAVVPVATVAAVKKAGVAKVAVGRR